MIDLRSDTVTKPTKKMRAAMAAADVGDDVYGEDPTVRALEDRVAELFGHPAALFTVTGSLANLLAIRSLVPVGSEVLCEAQAHIARAELGAHAAVNGVTMRTWSDPHGRIDLGQIETLVAPDLGPFLVRTAAVSVENTHNFGGGTVQPIAALRALQELAMSYHLGIHLDGARLWNAAVATGTSLREYGDQADVITVALSKGLGAPMGSLLIGPRETIVAAREWRKRLGGGWRQAGVVAAAGLYALDHHIDRLVDDHANARLLAEACDVDPADVETNIVVVPCTDAAAAVSVARDEGVLCSAVGPRTLRLVTHLDVSASDARRAAEVLSRVVSERPQS